MGSDGNDGAEGGRGSAPGRWIATSHVSTDVVRSNLVPRLVHAASVASRAFDNASGGAGGREGGGVRGVGGAIAARQMHHVVMSGAGADLGALALEDFVELVDYDPVRHVALVVGRRTAPPEAAILWLLCRVFQEAMLCIVMPGNHGREPQQLEPAPRGSFEEAMSVARALKAAGGPVLSGPALAVLERVGLVLVVPPTEDLETALGSVLRPSGQEDRREG